MVALRAQPLIYWTLLLLPLLVQSATVFTVERNGTMYTLNAGLCEEHSCGADERRGVCTNEIYRGRPAHYCRCNLPFTGGFCDETLRLNTTLPGSVYAQCTFPLYCAAAYGNGVCDQECNSAACLYDGYECVSEAVCPQEEYCRERFADGVCDEQCAREECEFDGGDCFGEMDTLPGQLLIRLSMTAQDFMRLSHLFLFQLSRFLRATVVLSQDAVGPLLWKWNAEEGRGARLIKGENSSLGIEVAFSVDLSRCSSECLDSVSRVVQFINQALASKSLPVSSALSSVLAASAYPTPSPSSFIRPDYIIFSIGVLFLLVSLVVGITLQQRVNRKRTLEAPVWMPPSLGNTASPATKRARVSVSTAPATSPLHKEAAGTGTLYITGADDVNGRDELGRTPLLLAVGSSRREAELRRVVQQLLAAGADITAVDRDGWGVLHHSLHKLRSPPFNLWLIGQGASVMVVDGKGRSLVHQATEYDDLANLKVILDTGGNRLIDTPDYSNRTPLSMAVSDCSLSVARCLLDRGANVNSEGDDQYDPSILLRPPLHLAVQYNNKEHVKLLKLNGCNMEARDSRLRSALHYAAIYADLSMCRMLVDAGVPVDFDDDEERSAEDIASELNMVEVRDYLISVRGANEPYRARKSKKPKRYSTDQGYGSEESQRASPQQHPSTPPKKRSEVQTPAPPLRLISPRKSFGIPTWAKGATLPMFQTGPLTPLARLANPPHLYPSVLTPANSLMPMTSSSSFMPPPFVSSTYHLTPL